MGPQLHASQTAVEGRTGITQCMWGSVSGPPEVSCSSLRDVLGEGINFVQFDGSLLYFHRRSSTFFLSFFFIFLVCLQTISKYSAKNVQRSQSCSTPSFTESVAGLWIRPWIGLVCESNYQRSCTVKKKKPLPVWEQCFSALAAHWNHLERFKNLDAQVAPQTNYFKSPQVTTTCSQSWKPLGWWGWRGEGGGDLDLGLGRLSVDGESRFCIGFHRGAALWWEKGRHFSVVQGHCFRG